MIRYRVEAVEWTGPADLQALLDEWCDDGWAVHSMVPTHADTSIGSLRSASGSTNTTQFALLLFRDE